MKKIIIVICGVIIFISALMFYGTTTSRDLFKEDLSEIVIEGMDISGSIDEVLTALPISEGDRVQVKQEMDKVQEEIIANQEFNQFVDQYSRSLINNVSVENSLYPDINHDVKAIIETYENDITVGIKDYVSESDARVFIDNIKNSVDLEPIYANLISKIRENVSPTQMKLIKIIDFFNHDITKIMSLIGLFGASALIIIFKKSVYKWALAIGNSLLFSGICLIGLSRIIPFAIPANLQINNNVIQLFISTECDRMLKFGFLYFGVAMILLLFYFVMRRREYH